MSTWSEGYAAEADYVAHYTAELNPLRSRLLLPHAGFALTEPLANACELGFGLGLSTVVHAAASPIKWWGTDFSPSQALFARELAAAGGVDIRLFDDSFAEFCARNDLPDFDFIALHGVWSWVSDNNRKVLVDFLKRKLRLGGVLYISYNAEPGWSQMTPLRKLMRLHVDRMQGPGVGALAHASAASDFIDQLLKDNPQIATAYPLAARSVTGLKKLGPSYISHEYLNRDWAPMSFADIGEQLDAGKLGFACSASPSQHFERHFLTQEQMRQLAAYPDPVMRESVRDFMINRRFRKDYWIKGGLHLPAAASMEVLLRQRVVLARPPSRMSRSIAEAALETELPDSLCTPLADLLADHLPRSLDEIISELAPRGLGREDLIRAVLILLGNDTLACAQEADATAAARETSLRLNQHLVSRSRHSGDLQALASPVTGSAIPVPQFHLQMLASRAAGETTPSAWARAVWQPYRDKGQVLTRNGAALLTEDDNLAYLTELATEFASGDLPVLQKLGCVD